MNLNGEIQVFLDCLGLKEGDDKILDAIVIIAMDFEIEEFDYSGVKGTYYLFYKRGVDFIFDACNDNILKSIFFHIKEIEGYQKYPFLEDLIISIDYSSSKEDIIKLLGEPEKKDISWIRYKVENKYLHFEFNNSKQLTRISLFIDTDNSFG